MKRRNRLALLLGAAALLAACAGAQQQSVMPAGQLHLRPHGRSWVDAGLAKQDLLYVSNGNGEVTVYRFWQHTLTGVLTDFTQPMGECAGNGVVFITDYAAQQILEYAHGGTKPIKTFDDVPDSPYGCAVDPTTGNLAVANDDGSSNEGNIAIWAGASGQPTTYTDAKLYNFQSCAYDGSGNLLVTNGNQEYPHRSYFAWLPKTGTRLIDVNVPGPDPSWEWYYVEGVQWDGKFFAIDDYEIYRIAVIHGQAYYVGQTGLTYPEEEGPGGPFWIYNDKPGSQGTQVVGGLYGEFYGSEVDYWGYPGGGEPTASISHAVDRPFGVVVSLKKS